MLKQITAIFLCRRISGFFFLLFSCLLYFLPLFLSRKLIQLYFSVLKKILSKELNIESRLQKGFIMHIVTCILLVFVLMPHSANASNKKAFHWVDDTDYPPLIYRTSEGKPAGIFYQIMTEAFHRLSIPLKLDTYPWLRSQKIVKEGKGDGMVTVLTKKRKRFFVGSDPILLVSEHIFVNENNPRVKEIMSIRSLEEIKKYRVVETLGSGWTEEQLKGFDITWVPSMDSAFKMLIKNRVDIFISNGYVGAAFLQKKIKEGGLIAEGYKSIITNPYPLRTVAFRLLIRKDSPFVKILDDFNNTIHQMQMDGTIRHIIEGIHLPQLERVLNQ